MHQADHQIPTVRWPLESSFLTPSWCHCHFAPSRILCLSIHMWIVSRKHRQNKETVVLPNGWTLAGMDSKNDGQPVQHDEVIHQTPFNDIISHNRPSANFMALLSTQLGSPEAPKHWNAHVHWSSSHSQLQTSNSLSIYFALSLGLHFLSAIPFADLVWPIAHANAYSVFNE